MPRFRQASVDHSQLSGVVAAQHQSPMMPILEDVGTLQFGLPGWFFGQQGNTVLVAEDRYYIPFYIQRTKTFTRIAVRVNTFIAATLARLGLYAASFNADGELFPAALILDAGTVDVSTNGDKIIIISQSLDEGFHFFSVGAGAGITLSGALITSALVIPVTSYSLSPPFGSGDGVMSVPVIDAEAALPDPAIAPSATEGPQFATGRLGW